MKSPHMKSPHMKSLMGHIAAGIGGSTIAGVVLESGSRVAVASLLGLCLCVVGAQLFMGTSGSARS